MKITPRKIDVQTYATCRAEGLSDGAAKTIAARTCLNGNMWRAIRPTLADLDSYASLPDVHKAARRIAQAILSDHEIIAAQSDYDCDGATSMACMTEALLTHFGLPQHRFQSYIGHRLIDHYGLSQSLCERILSAPERPSVVITADCGSSDEARIRQLKAAGIDVVVTDHHELPAEGIPASAYAVVSPLRADSRYPDRGIAGCMVAWLLMCAVRDELIAAGRQVGELTPLLDYVALGTVADCVSLAPQTVHNNRAVVLYGLELMNAGARPCWQAFKEQRMGTDAKLRSDTLGFQLGPLINAIGRLEHVAAGVNFLLAKSVADAERYLELLVAANDERKQIQRHMLQAGEELARAQIAAGAWSLVIKFSPGHPGVHGIVASRLKDMFGRPTICLSDNMDGQTGTTGSARGVEGMHLRAVLQRIADRKPGFFDKFGGHAMAAGLSISQTDWRQLQAEFELEIRNTLSDEDIGPAIVTDGEVHPDDFGLALVRELDQMEPYGNGFSAPIFEGLFQVVNYRVVGKDQNHLQLMLRDRRDGSVYGGIWFFYRQTDEGQSLFEEGDTVRVLFTLSENCFRGESRLQLKIMEAFKQESRA